MRGNLTGDQNIHTFTKQKHSAHADSLRICSKNRNRKMTGQYVLTVMRSNQVSFVLSSRCNLVKTVFAINTKS